MVENKLAEQMKNTNEQITVYSQPTDIRGEKLKKLWLFIKSISQGQEIKVEEIEDIVLYSKYSPTTSSEEESRSWFVGYNIDGKWTTVEIKGELCNKILTTNTNLLK
ncbi:hypothetical protein JCM14036_00910 [Desulfotomaculum defluvii]